MSAPARGQPIRASQRFPAERFSRRMRRKTIGLRLQNDWLCSDYISRLREEDGRATVTKSTSLYAGPSAANFRTIVPLETDDVVRLLYSAKVDGEMWYEVQIQAYIGWIDADSIRIHEKY